MGLKRRSLSLIFTYLSVNYARLRPDPGIPDFLPRDLRHEEVVHRQCMGFCPADGHYGLKIGRLPSARLAHFYRVRTTRLANLIRSTE
jgi:hypothetical protein